MSDAKQTDAKTATATAAAPATNTTTAPAPSSSSGHVTPATTALRAAGVSYTEHRYAYVEKGGTGASSAALGVSEHAVIKTLLFEERKSKKPLIVLMHGDLKVDTKALGTIVGGKVASCSPETATKHTGYLTGGTSPFGCKTPDIAIYAEESIRKLDTIHINGGERGFLVVISTADLWKVAKPIAVTVGMK